MKKTEWYWNNDETLIKMAPNEYVVNRMVKCSNKLQQLLDKEVKEVWV